MTSAVVMCDAAGKDNDTWIKKDSDGKMDWNATADAMAQTLGAQIGAGIETGIPTQLSYGFVCGYCSGYALKKVGKAAAVVLGLGFITLQTLQYSGYIQVDHSKMKKDVEGWMDFNDDGQINAEDGKVGMNQLWKVLEFNMPAGGGFAAGFVGGIRSG
jgi:FUN14 domain-containing protein 1